MTTQGERALITGASAGIGAAYARRLAREGYDLIVVARRRDRLEALAHELKPMAHVEVLEADLTDPSDLRRVEDAAATGISMLINNAGFGAYKPFVDLDPDDAEGLVGIHVRAPVRVTRAALPPMIAQGHGAIITVASMLAFSGTAGSGRLPQRVVYAAGKSFQVSFSQLLADELAGTGVKVQVCCPGVIATEFHTVQDMDMSHLPRMSADDVVQASLASLASDELICAPSVEDASVFDALAGAQGTVLSSVGSAQLAARYRA